LRDDHKDGSSRKGNAGAGIEAGAAIR
jgi:hypothetical protein